MPLCDFCCICRGPIIGVSTTGVEDRRRYISRKDEDWCNRSRVIFSSSCSPCGYQVSGIRYRYTHDRGSFDVPADRRVTVIHAWDKKSAGKLYCFNCRCTPIFQCSDSQDHCYQLHSYCWDITEQLLGQDLEDKLDFLVAALESAWEELPSEETEKLIINEPDDSVWWADGMNEFYSNSHPGPRLSGKERFAVLSDPFCIPGLQRALEEGKRRRDTPKTSGKVNDACEIHLKASCRSSVDLPLELPLELQLLVLDFLADLLDNGNAVAAFQWRLPDLYWRSKFSCDVLYELNDIPADEVDWESLSIEFGQLRRDFWALENRFRIFRLLHYTRDRFFETED